MELFLDFSPSYINSSVNEPCEVENQLVLQVRNSSVGSVTLINDSKQTKPAFKPIDEAVDIPGLSMIYFVFRIGEEGGCLTTAERFGDTQLLCEDGFEVSRVGDDTLVLFPTDTREIPMNGNTELLIQRLVTMIKPGHPTVCRVKFFNVHGSHGESRVPLSINRHPLMISRFSVAEGSEIASFRDYVTFSWLVLGADECLFIPGDVALDVNAREASAVEYTTVLYKPTMFTLIATQGKQKISKSCKLSPLSAEIVDFCGTSKPNGSGGYIATLSITVKNTRHAFINRGGRIEIESGVKTDIKIEQPNKAAQYCLMVENENGLVQRICDVK